jgi:hypothetical protein
MRVCERDKWYDSKGLCLAGPCWIRGGRTNCCLLRSRSSNPDISATRFPAANERLPAVIPSINLSASSLPSSRGTPGQKLKMQTSMIRCPCSRRPCQYAFPQPMSWVVGYAAPETAGCPSCCPSLPQTTNAPSQPLSNSDRGIETDSRFLVFGPNLGPKNLWSTRSSSEGGGSHRRAAVGSARAGTCEGIADRDLCIFSPLSKARG